MAGDGGVGAARRGLAPPMVGSAKGSAAAGDLPLLTPALHSAPPQVREGRAALARDLAGAGERCRRTLAASPLRRERSEVAVRACGGWGARLPGLGSACFSNCGGGGWSCASCVAGAPTSSHWTAQPHAPTHTHPCHLLPSLPALPQPPKFEEFRLASLERHAAAAAKFDAAVAAERRREEEAHHATIAARHAAGAAGWDVDPTTSCPAACL